MSNEFRLRSVTFQGPDEREIRVALADDSPAAGIGTTVVTGRNGAGKSRLLAHIAMAFDALDVEKPRPGMRSSVEYTIGTHRCVLSTVRGHLVTTVDDSMVDPSTMPRPKAVAAVTTSAFDRFQLPRGHRRSDTFSPFESVYQYLGLKDDRGRVSATAGVYRALDKIFGAVTKDSAGRERIAEVFDYLGYAPRIEIAYRWTARGAAFRNSGTDFGVKGYTDFLADDADGDGAWRQKSKRNLDDDLAYHSLVDAISILDKRGEDGQLSLVADFQESRWAETAHFRAAQLLKREGMLATKHVRLGMKGTERSILLGEVSSGELSLVTATLGIASAIDDQSLILIDEPEISLHPEWQSEYLERLGAAFGAFAGCHFVIATHSPLVVAGLTDRTQNKVLTLEEGHQVDRDLAIVAGRSTDEALIGAFGVAGHENLFIKQSLVQALRMASDRRFTTPEFTSLMSMLSRATRARGVDAAVREVVSDLEITVERAKEKLH